jgi:multiple sugar transport system substrate-binding protein
LLLGLLLQACQPASPTPTGQPAQGTVTPTQSTATRTLTPRPELTAPPPTLTPTLQPTSAFNLTAADLNGILLTFWRASGEHFSASNGQDVFQELVDEFNRENAWGISVQSQLFPDYGQIFDTLQSDLYGKRPDVLAGYNYQAARLDSSGEALVDLNIFVSDPKWGLSPQEVEDFYPVFWEQDALGGKRLGVPFYRSAQLLFYNASWGRELGFKAPPASAQEFKQQVCAAAKANREAGMPRSGGWAINTDAPTLLGWIFAHQDEVTGSPGSGYAFNNDPTRQAFSFLHSLGAENCAWMSENRYPNQEFALRQALVVTGSLSGLPYQAGALDAAGSKDEWTVLPFLGSAGEGAIVTYGPSLSILKSTQERELAAWLFIQWLLSPENQARWVQAYGVYPTRASTLAELANYQAANPQYAAALDLLPLARVEPPFASWRSVRWVVSDAGRFLFSPFFSPEQLPALLEELDGTARELHNQLR